MRIVVAALVLVLLGSIASAGLKCEKLPRIVFYSTEADVHDDGTWHRTKDKHEKQGSFDDATLSRFRAFVSGHMGDEQRNVKVIACLDALIAKPDGATATKACAVPKPSASRRDI